MRVVLFGDSIERLTAQDLADNNQDVCCHVRGEMSAECTGQCRTNASLVIETVHNNGVWPNGPYFVDEALPLSAIQAWQKVQCFVNRFDFKYTCHNEILRWR